MRVIDEIFNVTSSLSKFADIEDILDELFEIEHNEIEPFYEMLHKKINTGNYSVNFICDELLDIHTVCSQWILFYTICASHS